MITMEVPKFALIYILICFFLFGHIGNLSGLNRELGWLFRLIVTFFIFILCVVLSFAAGLDVALSILFILIGFVMFWVRRSQVIQDKDASKLTQP